MFKRRKGQTKVEYWNEWKFFDLLDHLHACDELIKAEFGDEKYDGTEIGELHAELIDAIDDVEFGNRNDLVKIHSMFSDSNPLTQFIKKRNIALFDSVLGITSNWTKNNI